MTEVQSQVHAVLVTLGLEPEHSEVKAGPVKYEITDKVIATVKAKRGQLLVVDSDATPTFEIRNPS